MYTHFTLNHPKHIFSGLIRTETIRYSKFSKTIAEYNFIKVLFSTRLTSLNYPNRLILKHNFPFLGFSKHQLRKSNNKSKHKKTIYFRSKFNKNFHTDLVVKRILNKYKNKHIPKLTQARTVSEKLHTLLLTNKVFHSKVSSINTQANILPTRTHCNAVWFFFKILFYYHSIILQIYSFYVSYTHVILIITIISITSNIEFICFSNSTIPIYFDLPEFSDLSNHKPNKKLFSIDVYQSFSPSLFQN